MKYYAKDVPVLLLSISIFSAGVGLTHAIKYPAKTNAHELADMTPQDALIQLSALRASRSVEKIVEVLIALSPDKMMPIVEEIIRDQKSSLTRHDQLTLIFALALHEQYHDEQRKLLFDLIVQHSFLYKGSEPFLCIAAHEGYERVIPLILSWVQKYHPDKAEALVHDAVSYAIRKNDFKVFEKLYRNGIVITSLEATQLLWRAVDNNDSGSFATLLVQAGADIHYVHDKKYTFLIRAAERNNYSMVDALLKKMSTLLPDKKVFAQAVDKVVDPAIGSALQIAVRNKFGKIDLLLRKYGARE